MVRTGLRLLCGSWKIIPISLPRTCLICCSVQENKERPCNHTSPAATRTASGNNRMLDRAVKLFPLPDSPTRATVSPAGMPKPRSLTRGVDPWICATVTDKLRTFNNAEECLESVILNTSFRRTDDRVRADDL